MFLFFSGPCRSHACRIVLERATRKGALGLLTSLVFGGISYFKLAKLPMHFSFYTFVIAIIAMIVVSLMTKQTSEKVLKETMTGWYIRK